MSGTYHHPHPFYQLVWIRLCQSQEILDQTNPFFAKNLVHTEVIHIHAHEQVAPPPICLHVTDFCYAHPENLLAFDLGIFSFV